MRPTVKVNGGKDQTTAKMSGNKKLRDKIRLPISAMISIKARLQTKILYSPLTYLVRNTTRRLSRIPSNDTEAAT